MLSPPQQRAPVPFLLSPSCHSSFLPVIFRGVALSRVWRVNPKLPFFPLRMFLLSWLFPFLHSHPPLSKPLSKLFVFLFLSFFRVSCDTPPITLLVGFRLCTPPEQSSVSVRLLHAALHSSFFFLFRDSQTFFLRFSRLGGAPLHFFLAFWPPLFVCRPLYPKPKTHPVY